MQLHPNFYNLQRYFGLYDEFRVQGPSGIGRLVNLSHCRFSRAGDGKLREVLVSYSGAAAGKWEATEDIKPRLRHFRDFGKWQKHEGQRHVPAVELVKLAVAADPKLRDSEFKYENCTCTYEDRKEGKVWVVKLPWYPRDFAVINERYELIGPLRTPVTALDLIRGLGYAVDIPETDYVVEDGFLTEETEQDPTKILQNRLKEIDDKYRDPETNQLRPELQRPPLMDLGPFPESPLIPVYLASIGRPIETIDGIGILRAVHRESGEKPFLVEHLEGTEKYDFTEVRPVSHPFTSVPNKFPEFIEVLWPFLGIHATPDFSKVTCRLENTPSGMAAVATLEIPDSSTVFTFVLTDSYELAIGRVEEGEELGRQVSIPNQRIAFWFWYRHGFAPGLRSEQYAHRAS